MLRINEIQKEFSGLVGWRQDYNPNKQIDEALTVSDSGLYFQDAHPLVTLENMRAIMPDDWQLQFPEWDVDTAYLTGSVVWSGTDQTGRRIYWVATIDNVGNAPASGSAFWASYDITSKWLEVLTQNGTNALIQAFIQRKQLAKETRNIMERKALFDGAGRIEATIPNTGRLVGFEIVPVRSMGVTAKIEKIGFQATGAIGSIKVYLFHSSQYEPIAVKELNYTRTNGGFQWFPFNDLFLPYISSDTNAGGSWYIVYDQNQIPPLMQSINIGRDWSAEPCGTCNRGNPQFWKQLTENVLIRPFKINVPGFSNEPGLWDIRDMIYTNATSYGLNLELTIGCDLTDFFISQKHIFATALQRQVAAIALRTLALNPDVRVVRNQYHLNRDNILYELDGNTSGVRPNGLGNDLRLAIEALNIDTKGLDRICLKCNNHGVKYRTV